MAPEYCPHCGAEVPDGARACPECGADEQTGWSERAHAQRLDLPDEDFDYAEFVRSEFEHRPPRRRGLQRFWWVVAVVTLLVWVAVWVTGYVNF